MGGQGGTGFEDRPPSLPFVVGFRYTTTTHVKCLQPIYLIEDQKVATEMLGNPEGQAPIEILAKPGYAVGGILAKASGRVDQMKIIFMRIAGRGLVAGDSYESPWIGGTGGGAEVKLAGDGSPVVGVYGRRGNDLDALGLIYLK